MSYEIEPNQ